MSSLKNQPAAGITTALSQFCEMVLADERASNEVAVVPCVMCTNPSEDLVSSSVSI